MKRNRFADEQSIAILEEHEAATPVSEHCGKRGVSDAGIYKRKAKVCDFYLLGPTVPGGRSSASALNTAPLVATDPMPLARCDWI
ncbi:hypothetical protein EV286_1052 [Rhizobium sp. BK251]|nr:hypothetical protein EV286_1052 [Rhizobium sp. BK251]